MDKLADIADSNKDNCDAMGTATRASTSWTRRATRGYLMYLKPCAQSLLRMPSMQ